MELAELGYTAAVQACRDEGMHIVVDLQGHTMGGRTEIAARRVAPIQVTNPEKDQRSNNTP